MLKQKLATLFKFLQCSIWIGWLLHMFEVSQAPLTLTVLPHLPSQLGFLLCAAVSVKGAAAMSPSSAHSNDWALKEES